MPRRRFRAMGTEIELVVDAVAGAVARRALATAESEFRRLERLLSRFDPASELSRLNRRGTMAVGPELLEVVEAALEARQRTRGRFDPTVHDALVASGYGGSFDRPPLAVADTATASVRCAGAVHVDRLMSTIALEPGVRLDLGGLGKGYAADRAAGLLEASGPCLVDAGGDIAVRGGPWHVGVETTGGSLTLELAHGAVATSGRDRRRWARDGEEQHHLIDPATGHPSESDLERVTVVAASAAEAEVLAKALFLVGVEAARQEADAERIPAVLVTRDGRTLLAGGLA